MGKIVAGDATLTISDERAFAHVRSAIIVLVTELGRSFFIEMGTETGRVATLCGPNLPLQLLSDLELADDDNDTWVEAIITATTSRGVLTLMKEGSAEDVLSVATEPAEEAPVSPPVGQVTTGPSIDELGPRF